MKIHYIQHVPFEGPANIEAMISPARSYFQMRNCRKSPISTG
jgi:hypothetical protein